MTREAVLTLLFLAFVVTVWKFVKDYGELIKSGFGSVARRYGLQEAGTDFVYQYQRRYFRPFEIRNVPRPWLSAAVLGVVVLLAAVAAGVYYSSAAIGAISNVGDIVAEDISGNRVQFTVHSEDELDRILAKLKQRPEPVNTLHFNVNITDLREVGRLTGLTSLDLDSTSVDNLEPLRNLESLTALDLGKTPFYDMDQIKYFPKLEWLDLSETKTRSFEPLSGLSQLQSLDLAATEIADLSPIRSLRKLKRLNLSRTNISDVRPLKELVQLEELDLSETEISDIGALSALTKLKDLDLSETNVRDVAPLYGLSSLRWLDLSETSIEGPEIEALRERMAELGNTAVQIKLSGDPPGLGALDSR
jgi:Leucine Rich repeats (2 copies)